MNIEFICKALRGRYGSRCEPADQWPILYDRMTPPSFERVISNIHVWSGTWKALTCAVQALARWKPLTAGATATAEAPGRDILSVGATKLASWINHLPPPFYLLPLRCALMFVLVALLCGYSFARGSRFTHRQAGLAAIAAAFGLSAPLHLVVPTNVSLKAWLFALSLAICVAAPQLVPFWITPTAGFQSVIKRTCYWLMAALVVLTFFLL
jgi:hypothetical protein